MKTLHVLPIKYRILFKLGLIAYKIFYRKAPEYLLMNFQTFQRNTSHNLRTDTGRDQFMFIVEVPKHKKECIFYKIKKHWNSLPLLLRNMDKIGNFKRQLKAHMFRMAFPETTVSWRASNYSYGYIYFYLVCVSILNGNFRFERDFFSFRGKAYDK